MSHTPAGPGRDRVRLRGRAALVLAAALVVLPGLASVAVAASPSPGPTPISPVSPSGAGAPTKATFGIGPAGPIKVKDAGVVKTVLGVDGRPYFYYTVTPGASFSDSVAIVNIGVEPLTLSAYATDAVNGSDGSFGLLPGASAAKDAGSWIHLALPSGRTSLVVPARSTVVVPVTVAIPTAATPGDHTAGLVASLASKAKDKNGDIVTIDQRVGTRMFIRISGALRPELAIEGLSAAYHGTLNPFGRGTATVTYTVHNTGNLRLAGHQKVEISGLLGGTGDATAIADIPLLLPGGSMVVKVDVTGVRPELWMTGTVTISPLALKGDVDPGLGTFSQSAHFWAVPWTLIALVVALILLGWWWLRRRRGTGGTPESAETGDVKEPVSA